TRDSKVVASLLKTFEDDWQWLEGAEDRDDKAPGEVVRPAKTAKKMAKAIARELPLTPIVKHAVKKVIGENADIELDTKRVQETIENAVQEGVKDAVKDVVKEAVEQNTGRK